MKKSIHLHATPGTFSLDEQLWQFFNIHSSQRRAAEIRFHIRHRQDAPITVCGLVCEVVTAIIHTLKEANNTLR